LADGNSYEKARFMPDNELTMGRGSSLVESISVDRNVVGSNPAQAAWCT